MTTVEKLEKRGDKEEEENYIYDDSYEIENWDDLEISANLLRGIYAYGFEKPSVIQQRAIPVVLTNKDVIAQAQSGTGKTGAFTISTL
jgi:translation initiation factor 4A